jgi:hypothetical protein
LFPLTHLATPRWLIASLAVALCLSLVSPFAVARASTDLSSGDIATIADANGDGVRLRAKPGASGTVIDELPEGTLVDILAGPTHAGDGTYWYQVTVNGETGYMVADYLRAGDEALNAATAVSTPAPTATAIATATVTPDDSDDAVQLAAITGSATIVNTGGDPIRCRASRSTKSEIVGLFSMKAKPSS